MNLLLATRNTKIRVNDDLSLSVLDRTGQPLWETSRRLTPSATVRSHGGKQLTFLLSAARDREEMDDRIRLSGFDGTDIVLEITLSADASLDELSVEIAQTGGSDTVVSVEHFYRFEKPVADGGHMILPHGSGYLIPADCADELPPPWEGMRHHVGERWTLPVFGLVRQTHGMCIIVDTWWDCEVREEHVPGSHSALDVTWMDNLGKLDYPRRLVLRFGQGMDYVEMAKIYRGVAAEQGLLRTLIEKARQTPVIDRFMHSVMFRWPAWNPEECQPILQDLRRLKEAGVDMNFFFPKWSSHGHAPELNKATSADAGWQAYLLEDPVPGGWQVLCEYAEAVHELGCPLRLMLQMPCHYPDAPCYDESRWARDAAGNILGSPEHCSGLGAYDAPERLGMVIDSLKRHGFKADAIYFDGYSAFGGIPPDHSRSHPMSRRDNVAVQNACFAETRRQGMIPSGELARFWSMAECDYFFYTDWAVDRLFSSAGGSTSTGPVGEPIPLFELVFHDCYMSGFAGGGHAVYVAGNDWWQDRTPRLYEMLFASAPAYNWLPHGCTPIPDWDSPRMEKCLAWLRRRCSYYHAIATSEMVTHCFQCPDRTKQRIEFANGVAAEFDMAGNRFRVHGVPRFSGEWETPEDLY